MHSLTLALRAVREIGPGPIALYALHRASLRIGWQRLRTPLCEWNEHPLAGWMLPRIPLEPEAFVKRWATQAPPFFFKSSDDITSRLRHVLEGREVTALKEADDILCGRFRLFGGEPVDLGFPPNWATFAPMAGGEEAPALDLRRHWSSYAIEALPADVKLFWEVARFGWVFPLARAQWLTGDVRYAEALWALIESWRDGNRSNAGLHWMSAQEVALRLMAMVFVIYAFAPQLVEVPERFVRLVEMIAVHADRIPPTLAYARAQGNNHLLVEAVALYTAGLLFPEFRLATRWRKLGRRWLIKALARQFFPDGGYIQHSANYHRLALQVGLWAARLAEVNGDPLPDHALDALRRAEGCMAALLNQENGLAPNFGPNDGAHFLPMSTCHFDDFRPTIQAASIALNGDPVYPPGPWDEACLWFGLVVKTPSHRDDQETHSFRVDNNGESTLTPTFHGKYPRDFSEGMRSGSEHRREDFEHAGLYFIRGRRTWGMLRCARFSSRPGHSDQLHFDLWRQGMNIACDPGTYLYNGSPPWDNGLTGANVHNTLVVNNQDPMRRAGRFLWLDWAQGHVLGRWRSAKGELEVLVAEHNGYRRMGVIHRRTVVRAGEDLWLVVDDLLGGGFHTACVGWLFPDGEWRLEGQALYLELAPGQVKVRFGGLAGLISLYRSGVLIGGEMLGYKGSLWGWRSRTYATLKPALRLITKAKGTLPIRLETWWSFDAADPLDLSVGWSSPGESSTAISWLAYQGERLEVNDAYIVDPSGLRHAG